MELEVQRLFLRSCLFVSIETDTEMLYRVFWIDGLLHVALEVMTLLNSSDAGPAKSYGLYIRCTS